ncbi:MAG TPA: nuclear transport factor 2 family protein, partial [Terriglobales bacterium]|nr:nuclear transport factor 2 family protein [Terriglobales bacterium]
MKTIFIVCLICLSNVIGHSQSPANDSNPDVDRLIALENAWNQAQLHRDPKALNDLVSSSFVYTDYDGTVMNKAQFMADLRDPNYRAT